MGRKKQTPEELLAIEVQGLEREYRNWESIYENGCGDPFWPDGANLELIKNHIIYGRTEIAKYCEQLNIQPPDIYFRKLPPNVPRGYMAGETHIRETARERIQALEARHNAEVPGSPYSRSFQQYKDALEQGDLAALRRMNNLDFERAAAESEKREHSYEETPGGQLGLFARGPIPRRSPSPPGENELRIKPLSHAYLSLLRDAKTWNAFLRCAAAQYKYSFENQTMIFGQFPEASCVADEEAWRKLGRGLRKQAVGITVLRNQTQGLQTETVYDISQTLGYELASAVSPERFAFTREEGEQLNVRLREKFRLPAGGLPEALNTLADGLTVTLWGAGARDRTFTLAQNSAKAILFEKFGLPYAYDFGIIESIEASELPRLGRVIQQTAARIIKTAEYQLQQIRSEQQNELSGERRKAGADDQHLPRGGGQLAFGEIRADAPAVHGRMPQRADVGFGDGRDADAQAARAGGVPGRVEADASGEAGEAEPAAGHGQFYGDRAAHEPSGHAGGGAGAGGTVSADLTNYHCTDLHPQYGGSVTKFEHNVEAIRLLKRLEESGSLAGSAEQAVLAQYTGWGGIPQAFDPDNQTWGRRYAELKALLSPEEYDAARASTLNAFYTPLPIAAAIHRGLLNMGFTARHRYLEPAMGPGNFFAALPKELQGAELHGVELDDLTGRIARRLYPNAYIQIAGFETMDSPDNFFDCAFGNVPFGNYPVFDERYNKLHLYVHDYFFAKSLDKVAPGGVIAYITSKGTLDKADGTFRKYLAERAELIGAVRLPGDTMRRIANTEVTADILFLRKRERRIVCEPDWVSVGLTEDGVSVNGYYLEHSECLLGRMVFDDSMYGSSKDTALRGDDPNFDLEAAVDRAIQGITAGQPPYRRTPSVGEAPMADVIPADPDVKNFTYTVVDGEIYYRCNEEMQRKEPGDKQGARIRGLHAIRRTLRAVINLQTQDNPYEKAELHRRQRELNEAYDGFVREFGHINDKANRQVFRDDADYPLLASVEREDEAGNFGKEKIFAEATIRRAKEFVPKSYEDLIPLSMTEKGRLHLSFMAAAFGVAVPEVAERLEGKIYRNPAKAEEVFHKRLEEYIAFANERGRDLDPAAIRRFAAEETADTDSWETADEYLTGNVREKLDVARKMAARFPEVYAGHVAALEQVQPVDLTIDQIDYQIGSAWIPVEYYQQFMYELGETPNQYRQIIKGWNGKSCVFPVYDPHTAQYTIYNKGAYRSVVTTSRYGTERKPFFYILEDSLNQRESKVYDKKIFQDKNGGDYERDVINVPESQAARRKQELIQNEFKKWILADPKRMREITRLYNDKFNVFRLRAYNGSKLTFPGMSTEIELRPHQRDSVARILYGGNNTILAHVVGAGKTYVVIAAVMEQRRLGLYRKPLIAVPNHLTEQWGSDWLKLYPNANILVATKRDFEPERRKRFFGKIAAGDYDAIILGHSQFGKIPMSREYEVRAIQAERDEILTAIGKARDENGNRSYTVKQLEAQRKRIDVRLANLHSAPRDDLLTFEETGVDTLVVDEAHLFKNCYVYTKLTNVAGITNAASKKSADLLMKTNYLTERNNGRGVVFATGTPISNSMSELYVMQRYLQPHALRSAGLRHFDEWASVFGEVVSVPELKPEGTGWRLRTRFAKFHNLPELMGMFSQVADIKVTEDLALPRPALATGKPIVEVCQPDKYVRDYILGLAERAEEIRGGLDPRIDNMLKVTMEGRAVAIDPRILVPGAPDTPDGKISRCVENVYKIWERSTPDRAAQLIFLDVSTPGKAPAKQGVDGFTNAYEDIKRKLTERGIPVGEIAFIHDAATEEKKAALFARVRGGSVRVLLGSTSKMGAGTNVQDRLIALHHLDCPWRPADIEQREGRILRQGNRFDEVYVYRYVTRDTFDSYLWQTQETKQKFIGQIMTNKSAARSCEDIDGAALDYAEVKMLATGDPRVREKMQLENGVAALRMEQSAYLREYARLQTLLGRTPKQIEAIRETARAMEADIAVLRAHPKGMQFHMTISGVSFEERADAAAALSAFVQSGSLADKKPHKLGEYRGLELVAQQDGIFKDIHINVRGQYDNHLELGESALGNITRIENACNSLEDDWAKAKESIRTLQKQMADAESELKKPFEKAGELNEKQDRLIRLNAEMEVDRHTDVWMDETPEHDMEAIPVAFASDEPEQ